MLRACCNINDIGIVCIHRPNIVFSTNKKKTVRNELKHWKIYITCFEAWFNIHSIIEQQIKFMRNENIFGCI